MSKAASDTLEKVSQEFIVEVAAELLQARDEALAGIEAAQKETTQAVQKIIETGSKQADSLKRQLIGAAELETRNGHLRSLEKVVTSVFEEAVNGLKGAHGARHEAAIARLVQEGVEVIGPKAKVSCNTGDKNSVSATLRKLNAEGSKLTLDEEPIETIGGVVLTSSEGSVRFDNTFEARLERMRPSLRKEVASLLTGE